MQIKQRLRSDGGNSTCLDISVPAICESICEAIRRDFATQNEYVIFHANRVRDVDGHQGNKIGEYHLPWRFVKANRIYDILANRPDWGSSLPRMKEQEPALAAMLCFAHVNAAAAQLSHSIGDAGLIAVA